MNEETLSRLLDRLPPASSDPARHAPSANSKTNADPADDSLRHSSFAGSPTGYNCPDGTSVSRALHLARLSAGWSVCDQCPSRTDSEGLSEIALTSLQLIRDHRSDGIVRTEFGVRGPYINRIDRRTVVRLTQVFCDCFTRSGSAEPTIRKTSVARDEPRSTETPQQVAVPSVIAGFDGRSSSPDLFVGVISAIRSCGLNVIDAGRCTAASLTEATRAFPDCAGAFLVTGAGFPTSWTGLDVIDRHGDPAAVVWKDHGVRLHSLAAPVDASRATETTMPTIAGKPKLILTLPTDDVNRIRSHRISRRSGDHQITDFEERYYRWLVRWFPATSSSAVAVITEDCLIADRLRRLSDQIGFSVIVRSPTDRTPLPQVSVMLSIDEDDRSFAVTDSAGRSLSAVQLADRLNRRIRSESPHITAHGDAASGRFWLTDAGRPTSSFSTEQIRDAVATLGLLLKLV